MESRNIIFKTKFGSHLYGTESPESDTDYKGIYLPTIEDCVLQQVAKTINNDTKKTSIEKNTKEDIDEEYYSLQYFLQLAYKGETVAIDMLHVPEGFPEVTSNISHFLWKNRSKFYTKNLTSLIEYCQGQASKYGVKGSRLADAEKMLLFLKTQKEDLKLQDIWEWLPEGEHIKKIEVENCAQDDNRAVEICNRKLMANTKVKYAIECTQKFYDSYGERAKKAKENKGIDWKAIHHAFRAGYQLKEIYETGNLVYPLEHREFLKGIKLGYYHYQDDGIGTKLENLIDEVMLLAEKSNFPEKVDKKFFEDWLVSLYT